MSHHVEKRGMHEMKHTVQSFALPLLLALAPAAAPAARLLWVNVAGSATVVDATGTETSADLFQLSGMGVNAFRVSVSGENAAAGADHLRFAYEDALGSMVVEDTDPDARPLVFGEGGALWAPLDLVDYTDPDLVVTLEVGHVDWDAFDAAYDANDPATWDIPFETLAVTTETLGNLLGEPHFSRQSDLDTPSFLPWSPNLFTASWAVPLIQRATGSCEDIIVSALNLSSFGLGGLSGREAISNILNTVQSNGCRVWENMVLGNARTNLLVATVPTVLADGLGLRIPSVAPVADYGYDVLYEVRRAGGSAAGLLQRTADSAELAIPLYPADRDDLRNPSGLYRVWTLLVPQSNLSITNAIASTNTIGVLKVTSSMTNTITAVPWTALAGDPVFPTNVPVAQALHPANLATGDRILAWNGAAGRYDGWELSGSGTWQALTAATIDGVSVTEGASDRRFASGSAFWVVRAAPLDGAATFPYFLYGQMPSGGYAATVPGGSTAAPASTLCANPTADSIPLNNIVFEGEIGAGDTIAFTTDGNLTTVYVRNAANTSWGHNKRVRVGNRIRNTWLEDGVVAPGTGFWYVRRSAGDLVLHWPGWEEPKP